MTDRVEEAQGLAARISTVLANSPQSVTTRVMPYVYELVALVRDAEMQHDLTLSLLEEAQREIRDFQPPF